MGSFALANNIYHIGGTALHKGLECNPYLLIDSDIGVLFDPGSSLDFDIVYQNLIEIIPLSHIKYIVLHHQDPDLCSALPLFEQKGLSAEIVTSWRAMSLIQYYNITSPFYLINEHRYQLKLPSGRVLNFLPTPYLHFAGAFTTYDHQSKCLFSSDLFGAFSYNHTFFADDDYLDKMLTFHEHYMPSNAILRPVMDMFERLDIRMILPQHGAIIKERIDTYIDALRNLECGALLKPIKKHIMDSGGYLMLFKEIYHRYKALFDVSEVEALFSSCGCFSFDAMHELTDYTGSPDVMWNHVFDRIYELKGVNWLIVIDPLVKRISIQYDIAAPKIFQTLLTTISEENQRLSDEMVHLENTIRVVNERLIKCPVTGLYNERFFKTLMLEELENEDWRDIGAYVCIDIDDFSKYKIQHGAEQGKDALSSMIYMIGETFGSQSVFKMDQSDFGLYIRGTEKQALIRKLDTLRVTIAQSDAFLSPLTVSMGIAFPNELILDAPTFDTVADSYITLAYDRMRRAKQLGKNIICFEGDHAVSENDIFKILLVDSDETNLELIKVFLKEMHIEVLTAKDGIAAREVAFTERPSLVVSEINLPRLDGFLLRESLLENSQTKHIPMIFLSFQKDEASVTRAQQLGISHYFKKPYMLYELLGIVKYYIKG
ncbi:MAG: hypothetical protein PWP38_1829 [Clostridiales bacterium]|jgi:PleD family two-component response regulator/glyoxylase-like metal-dependent hydrolase (beta-lactamase superfamily II)|nr:hypothetical protein [Clostridiales bacterium]